MVLDRKTAAIRRPGTVAKIATLALLISRYVVKFRFAKKHNQTRGRAMKTTIRLTQISLATALACTVLAAGAQAPTSTTGYVVDQRGLVAKSGTGLCWRTGYWTPAMAILECDPALVPPDVRVMRA